MRRGPGPGPVWAWAAADFVGVAWDLAVKLPGTAGAFRAGTVLENKAWIIAAATQLLTPQEARAARRWSWTGPGR